MQATLWTVNPPSGWHHHPRGLQHTSGLVLADTTAAEQASTWLADMDGWRVYYDPSAENRPSLNPWTATHEEHSAIAAKTLPALALLAHHAGRFEDWYPDVAPDLYDALWLAGWRWNGSLFRRGIETLDADEPAGLLWESAHG